MRKLNFFITINFLDHSRNLTAQTLLPRLNRRLTLPIHCLKHYSAPKANCGKRINKIRIIKMGQKAQIITKDHHLLWSISHQLMIAAHAILKPGITNVITTNIDVSTSTCLPEAPTKEINVTGLK